MYYLEERFILKASKVSFTNVAVSIIFASIFFFLLPGHIALGAEVGGGFSGRLCRVVVRTGY